MSSPSEVRAHWQTVIDDWRGSGLTLKEFSRQRQLKYHQLVDWKNRLAPRPAAERLTLLPAAPTSAPNRALVVCLPGGVRIEVEPGFNPQLLAQVVGALTTAAPC